MAAPKNTAGPKYDLVARDPRVRIIRPATIEESEGDHTFVMVELVDGVALDGESRFLATGVQDVRKLLARTAYAE